MTALPGTTRDVRSLLYLTSLCACDFRFTILVVFRSSSTRFLFSFLSPVFFFFLFCFCDTIPELSLCTLSAKITRFVTRASPSPYPYGGTGTTELSVQRSEKTFMENLERIVCAIFFDRVQRRHGQKGYGETNRHGSIS
ncbi:uncharacterized protein LOC143187246 [Calliopsis andreniformis]|uniref:uncharacterized protein LOC143187246 n=1 Tax=Calliopsis andreniformis TaxID=337506 RepID=UPI003FCEAE4A